MENEPLSHGADEGRSRKGRIMGKLFGSTRDRKVSNEQKDSGLNDFLHGPSDTLGVAHAAPQMLSKLDTHSAARYPNALSVHSASHQSFPLRARSHSPRIRSKKNLVVRFVDTFPEIIGEGGDESEAPPAEVGLRKRAKSAPGLNPQRPTDLSEQPRAYSELRQQQQPPDISFNPAPLRRTQTGYSTISDATEREIPAGAPAPAPFLDSPKISKDEKRKSFIELHQAEMRQAEGLAFSKAVRSASDSPGGQAQAGVQTQAGAHPQDGRYPQTGPQPPAKGHPQEGGYSQVEGRPQASHPATGGHPAAGGYPQVAQPQARGHSQELRRSPPSQPVEQFVRPTTEQLPRAETPPELRSRAPTIEQSPSSIYSTTSSYSQPYAVFRQNSKQSDRETGSPSSPLKNSMNLHDVVVAAGDDALNSFVSRVRHLFELFRLHSETKRPLLSCTADDLARATLWWFLQGRLALESAIRERPTSPQAQQAYEMAIQQSYADLAKGYWLSEEVLPEILNTRRSPVDGEVDEVRKSLVSNLRKLAVSMKRNGFLPPEEALLPQAIDKSVWVDYPPVSQDILALLWGCWGSALSASQRPTPMMSMLESLPLGDTGQYFSYGRVQANVFLMEKGMESQRFHFSCLLSMIRPLDHPDLVFVVGSQNGSVQLKIQNNKKAGPTWDDLEWRSKTCTIDINLPRGFALVIQLSQQDFRLLRSMYDFGMNVQATLYPRKDEQVLFRSTLRSFQYFDSDAQARQFPKEAVPNCEVGLYERVLKEGAATGPRSFHRGFRVAVVTGTRTRTLCGVNNTFLPAMPIQFSFLRGEQEDPALLLNFDNGRTKGRMVLSFNDDQERLRLHGLMVGTALHSDERVFSEVPLVAMTVSKTMKDVNGISVFKKLPHQRIRVINYEDGSDTPTTVLADKLRLVVQFNNGTITDRVNVEPGELKIRLDVRDPKSLMVLRQPQQDMTVAATEARDDPEASRKLRRELTDGLEVLRDNQSCRTYQFTSLKDLHDFQATLTGFKVIFDGIASTFAISRRRMVVPIHKKWEAGKTRIQVVQQDKVTQLLAFFHDFHHGQSMGFVLKGTDVFEAFSRSGKSGLKIDDAKFPLPKMPADGEVASDDAAFVCLDLPDLPGEHDDITILFENEADRDQLISCLPAPVRNSRLSRRY